MRPQKCVSSASPSALSLDVTVVSRQQAGSDATAVVSVNANMGCCVRDR